MLRTALVISKLKIEPFFKTLFSTSKASKSCFASGLLFFMWVNNLYSQSDKNYIVSMLTIGTCINEVEIDKGIDSLCKINTFSHYYYLKGIEENEVDSYSYKIFGRKFDKAQLINSKQADELGINKYSKANLIFYVINGSIVKSCEFRDFSISDFSLLKFTGKTENKSFVPTVNSKKDSFVLNYSYKVKVKSDVRFNLNSKVIKHDKCFLVLDPTFNQFLYKVSDSGNVINKVNLKDELVSYDTLLSRLYSKYFIQNHSLRDSLMKYSNILKDKMKTNYYNLSIEDSFVYLSGDRSIINFNEKSILMPLNYKMIYKFDMNLKLVNFYIDQYLSYSGFFVDFTYLDNFNSKRFQHKVINLENQEENIVRTIYCKLRDEGNSIYKYDRDILKMPKSFPGIIYSNRSSHISNVGDSTNRIWLMDPYPFLYFQKDSMFYNFINSETYTLSQIDTANKSDFTSNQGVLGVLKIDNILYINFNRAGFVTSIAYDLKNKKVVKYKKIGRIFKYKLNVGFDPQGNLFYYPLDNSINSNYFYIE